MGCVDNSELLGAGRDQGISIDEKLRFYSSFAKRRCWHLRLTLTPSHPPACRLLLVVAAQTHMRKVLLHSPSLNSFVTSLFQNRSLLRTRLQNLLVVRGGLSGDSLLSHRHTQKKRGFEERSCAKVGKEMQRWQQLDRSFAE